MSEGWHFITDSGRWFPYVVRLPDDTFEVAVHHEHADTDMGDLSAAELCEYFPRVRAVVNAKPGKHRK